MEDQECDAASQSGTGSSLSDELSVALDMVPQHLMPIICILFDKIAAVGGACDRVVSHQESAQLDIKELKRTVKTNDGVCRDLSNEYTVNRNRIASMEAELKNLRNRVNEQKKLIQAKEPEQKGKSRGPVTRSASLTGLNGGSRQTAAGLSVSKT